MWEDPGPDTRRRLSVTEAADALGITVDAVRSRVKRGTIAHVRVGARVYVLLGDDESRPGRDQHTDQRTDQGTTTPEDRSAELIATLREQLQAERQAHAEARRIIAGLVERIPALEAPSETSGSYETFEQEQGQPRSEVVERENRVEGHKLAAEAAKALVIVGSGLLVGMAAVVGVMPDTSVSSPLLYAAYALILISILCGIVWMRDIVRVTMSSDGDALGEIGYVAVTSFMLGIFTFVLYVLWNDASRDTGNIMSPDTPREQALWLLGLFGLFGVVALVGFIFRWWRSRRRSGISDS
jgi:excisionase family DNA binding protein